MVVAPPTIFRRSVRLAGLTRVNDYERNEEKDIEKPKLVVVVVQVDESTVLYQNCVVWSEEKLEIN